MRVVRSGMGITYYGVFVKHKTEKSTLFSTPEIHSGYYHVAWIPDFIISTMVPQSVSEDGDMCYDITIPVWWCDKRMTDYGSQFGPGWQIDDWEEKRQAEREEWEAQRDVYYASQDYRN